MHFLTSLARGLVSSALVGLLPLLAIVSTFVIVLGTSTQLKQSLSDSHIYDNFVDTAFEAAKAADKPAGGVNQPQQSDEGISSVLIEDTDALPIDDPAIRNVVKSAVTPAFLRQSIEQVLDGTYRWLQGKVPKPDFRIDLTGVRQQLIDGAGAYAANRAQGLPACTFAQLRSLGPNVDPFKAPCLPPGVTPDAVRAQVVGELQSNPQLVGQPVLTADTLPKNNQGQTPFDQAKELPRVFGWFRLAPWLVGGLVVLLMSLLILVRHDRRHGLKTVAGLLLGAGVVLGVGVWLLRYLFQRATQPGGFLRREIRGEFQTTLISLFDSLQGAFGRTLLWFAIIYVVLGLGTLLALHFTKPATPRTAK